MNISQKERQTRGLDLLGAAVATLVDQRMSAAAGQRPWVPLFEAKEAQRLGRPYTASLGDPRLVLRIVRFERGVFTEIEATQRAWLDETIQAANRAAHSTHLEVRQVDRVLDTMMLLAESLGLDEVLPELAILRVAGQEEAVESEAAFDQGQGGQAAAETNPAPVAGSQIPAATASELGIDLPPGVLPIVVQAGSICAVVILHEALNYALIHNGVSPVAGMTATNRGASTAVDVHVSVDLHLPHDSSIDVAVPLTVNLGVIEPGETLEPTRAMLKWRPSPAPFLQLDEAVPLVATATISGSGGEASASATVRALTADEWWAGSTPDSLAPFVRPNDRAVGEILASASELLARRTPSPALDGYQSGPERVNAIAEAIYDALQGRGITYVEPPASFEGTGQRIRSHSEVWEQRIGTCLDLACIYAAALEQAGLAPVLVVARGHAFCGFLLEDTQLAETVVSTPGAIRNTADSDLFDAVETTALCLGESSQTFDDARGGVRRWWTEKVDDVRGLVDVRAAHRWFKPLPTIRRDGTTHVVEIIREAEAAPARRGTPRRDSGRSDEAAPARVARWRRSLLDLTYANPLLKLKKASTASIHVPTGALGRLEDHVASCASLTLVPSDEVAQLHALGGARTAADVDPATLRAELDQAHRLFLALSTREAGVRLKGLQRRASTAREETGADSLYLALGTLCWSERSREGEAPLFLVPVRLLGGRGGRGYSIELDPTREIEPNFCLHEKLRTAFALELPELVDPGSDEAGIDVDGALRSIRRRLLEHKAMDFHVEETASLATFQFATLGMWRDLQQNWEALAARPVVKHLIESAGRPFLDPADPPVLDDTAEATTYLPIPADGSQLKAVRWAAAGRSFILEGPPGTGKSQTITNLISHCLAEGKKVLFVAEKPAALEVVQRRLDAVGLGVFSLDVHGATQTATAVRAQLQEALETDLRPTPGWQALQATYRNLVQSLAHYPRKLHEPGPAGLSAWDARQLVLELRSTVSPEAPEVVVDRRVTLTTEAPEVLYKCAEELGDAVQTMGVQPSQTPWRLAGPLQPGRALDRAELARALQRLEGAEDSLRSSAVEMLLASLTDADHEALARWLDTVAAGVGVSPHHARAVVTARWRQRTSDASGAIERFRSQYGEVTRKFLPEVLVADLAPLLVQAEAADKKLFGKKKARAAVVAQLQRFASAPVESHEITATLRYLQSAAADLSRLVPYVRGVEAVSLPPDFNPLRDDQRERFRAQVAAVEAAALLGDRAPLPTSAVDDVLRSGGPRGSVVREFSSARGTLLAQLGATQADEEEWRQGGSWREARNRTRDQWGVDARGGAFVQLERWLRVRTGAEKLRGMGAGAVVDEVLHGRLRGYDVEPVVRLAVAQAILEERLENTDLRGFDPEQHSRQVERFIRTGIDVRDRLLSELPARIVAGRTFDARRQTGLVGDLRQQISRRRGGLSIRGLMQRFAPIMTEVTPCFLMSPASVAKFLPAGSVDFDVVVFDEASQIRVPEAIGAMGRGKAVVIVGDSKQMPPTAMFSAAGSNDDEEQVGADDLPVPVDMDSILTEGVEANLQRLLLSWHYRSRDESLIAFSNQHYYEGRLASFPAPPRHDGPTAVHLRRVSGIWEGGSRGAARVNRGEAEAVCVEVRRLLGEDPDRSIGVVTFNTQQRDLILDRLEQLAEDDRSLSDALTKSDEPLFVKNLENVQGDERDVILFTLAFARDARGKVPLNWGPLTRAGGEKRFNVAVTRAKQQVVVFCSFDPHDLDLSTSSSAGLADLKDYLLLARDGAEHALVRRHVAHDLHLDEVKERLEGAGLEVKTAVGLSTFTVDLAARVSDEHEWLAVLLDGPAWAARESVSDRDGLPASVLSGQMGWARVARVWLAEWLRDADAVVARVVADATHLRALQEPKRDLGMHIDASDLVASPAGEDLKMAALAHGSAAAEADLSISRASTLDVSENSSEAVASEPFVVGETLPGMATFDAADIEVRHSRTILDETGRRATQAVVSEILSVIEAEGPILTSRLAKLVAHRFGLDRMRGTREGQILRLLPRERVRRSPNGDSVAWPEGVSADDYRAFRSPGDARVVADVPYEELRNAMVAVVRSAYSMGEDDLLRETARVFGWTRLGANVRERLGSVLGAAVREGDLVSEGVSLRAS